MRDKYIAWIIGTGLVLFAIHNPSLTIYKDAHTAWFFLPALGAQLAVMATVIYVIGNIRKLTLGSKWYWIPLAIIALSIVISETIQYIQGNKEIGVFIGSCSFALFLFCIYLVARKVGQPIFVPFTYATIICSISCVVMTIATHGQNKGGLISPTNYDMASGLLIFGALVTAWQHRWWVSSIALIGLAFIAAPEAMFILGVLVVTMIIRRDWSKKILLPIGIMVFGVALLLVTNTGGIYDYTKYLIENGIKSFSATGQERDNLLNIALGYRWLTYWHLSPIQPFGYGYNVSQFYEGIPHNIMLIIIEQVGIIAAIAWLTLTLYAIIKTKWKYAFIGLLAMGVLDHYVWTQVAPYWWVTIGVASTTINNRPDYIFRQV